MNQNEHQAGQAEVRPTAFRKTSNPVEAFLSPGPIIYLKTKSLLGNIFYNNNLTVHKINPDAAITKTINTNVKIVKRR